jgi:hypothetical protein
MDTNSSIDPRPSPSELCDSVQIQPHEKRIVSLQVEDQFIEFIAIVSDGRPLAFRLDMTAVARFDAVQRFHRERHT